MGVAPHGRIQDVNNRKEVSRCMVQLRKAAHYSLNERLQNWLQERNRPIRELEATLRWRCEEFFIVPTEACLKTVGANRRIKKLENKVREADCYRETVEAAPHGHIKN